jgi:hypothetical protein
VLRMKQTASLVRAQWRGGWGEVISTCMKGMKGMQSRESPDQSSSRQFGRNQIVVL